MTEAQFIEEREKRAAREAEELPKANGARYSHEPLFVRTEDLETKALKPEVVGEKVEDKVEEETKNEEAPVEDILEKTLPLRRGK